MRFQSDNYNDLLHDMMMREETNTEGTAIVVSVHFIISTISHPDIILSTTSTQGKTHRDFALPLDMDDGAPSLTRYGSSSWWVTHNCLFLYLIQYEKANIEFKFIFLHGKIFDDEEVWSIKNNRWFFPILKFICSASENEEDDHRRRLL